MQIPETMLGENHSAMFKTYRDKRYSKYGFSRVHLICYNPESTERNRYRWVENVSDGLRFVGSAYDVCKRESSRRVEHTGWYVDNFQEETCQGLVYQLPSRDGKPCYVPAVSDPWNNDCALVDFHSTTDELLDCVKWADSMAERYAEDSREYAAKDTAEQRQAEIANEIKQEYKAFRDLARELRANCDKLADMPQVKALIRDHWATVKERIHGLRTERDRIADNYWEASPQW